MANVRRVFMKDMTFISRMILVGCIALAGCMQYGGGGNNKSDEKSDLPYIFDNFSDIPVPDKMTMNMRDTRIYGRENDWSGTIRFNSPYDMNGIFDFYMYEMPKFGWLEITSIRSDNSAMSFIRDRRVAMIQISQRAFGGSDIRFTVAPAPPGIRSANSNDVITANNRKTASSSGISPMQKSGTTSAAARSVSTEGNVAEFGAD